MANESKRDRLARWALAIPRHELEFIMKIGKISRPAAIALIDRHDGDRSEVYADLARQRAAKLKA